MFLKNYLSEFYYNQVIDMYDESYLNSINESNFREIYQLFKKYNFVFIEDIILKYLEIFELDFKEVYRGIEKLKNKLGDNYMSIISSNMDYLSEILNND